MSSGAGMAGGAKWEGIARPIEDNKPEMTATVDRPEAARPLPSRENEPSRQPSESR